MRGKKFREVLGGDHQEVHNVLCRTIKSATAFVHALIQPRMQIFLVALEKQETTAALLKLLSVEITFDQKSKIVNRMSFHMFVRSFYPTCTVQFPTCMKDLPFKRDELHISQMEYEWYQGWQRTLSVN